MCGTVDAPEGEANLCAYKSATKDPAMPISVSFTTAGLGANLTQPQ